MCEWKATREKTQIGTVVVILQDSVLELQQLAVQDHAVKTLLLGRGQLALRCDVDPKEGAKEIAQAYDALLITMRRYLRADYLPEHIHDGELDEGQPDAG